MFVYIPYCLASILPLLIVNVPLFVNTLLLLLIVPLVPESVTVKFASFIIGLNKVNLCPFKSSTISLPSIVTISCIIVSLTTVIVPDLLGPNASIAASKLLYVLFPTFKYPSFFF